MRNARSPLVSPGSLSFAIHAAHHRNHRVRSVRCNSKCRKTPAQSKLLSMLSRRRSHRPARALPLCTLRRERLSSAEANIGALLSSVLLVFCVVVLVGFFVVLYWYAPLWRMRWLARYAVALSAAHTLPFSKCGADVTGWAVVAHRTIVGVTKASLTTYARVSIAPSRVFGRSASTPIALMWSATDSL